MKLDQKEILTWFSGKSLERATESIRVLVQCLKEGQWLPKASRSVRAALGKSKRAYKLGVGVEPQLKDLKTPAEYRKCSLGDGFRLVVAMQYGDFDRLLSVDMAKLRALAKSAEAKEALSRAEDWYKVFKPVAESLAELDATRPPPVITSIGVSPTITKTLRDANLDLDLSTIRFPPYKLVKIVKIDEVTGKKVIEYEMAIQWPKGMIRDASRFAGRGKGVYRQCEACGHAIKNPFNWVPLLIDNAKGKPYLLWVGNDCSKNVFGIKVTGAVKIREAKGKKK